MTGATSEGATDTSPCTTTGNGAQGVDPRFERSVSRWLRAYPRRWRAARAAEVTAVLADLAEPGARRLDLRSGLGLVRSGWATRWREHPPPLPWLGYRLLDQRLPAQHRAWVRDDLAGGLLHVRALSPYFAFMGYLAFRDDGLTGLVMMTTGIVVVSWVLLGGHRRRESVRRHLSLQPGEAPDAQSLITGWVYRTRVQAVGILPLVAGVLGLGAVAGAVAAGRAHRRLVATGCGAACVNVEGGPVDGMRTELLVVVAALLLGLALVPLVRRRLLRHLPGPDQPSRWLVYAGWRHRTGAAIIAAFAGGWAIAEASGHLVLVSTPATAACCLLAPGAIAASLLVRGRPELRDVAGADVWRASVRSRSPQVDGWVPGLVPAVVVTSAELAPGSPGPA
ncbi:hypothetical protein ACTHAM_001786 [Cellulomonas soli]|uniref:hypothetical protein n=1 Tax=Cellulomonas soli TaxID=931535 RepID=UPI003F82752D